MMSSPPAHYERSTTNTDTMVSNNIVKVDRQEDEATTPSIFSLGFLAAVVISVMRLVRDEDRIWKFEPHYH